jgi:hypothetical protein
MHNFYLFHSSTEETHSWKQYTIHNTISKAFLSGKEASVEAVYEEKTRINNSLDCPIRKKHTDKEPW